MVKIITGLGLVVVLALFGEMGTTASAEVASTEAERFYLSGVVVVDGGDAKAWLQEPSLTQDRPVVLRVGDRIGRWTLTAISPNRVELHGPGGKVFVPLHGVGGPGSDSRAEVASSAPATVESPPVLGSTLHIAIGDPRRRENMGQLAGTLREIARDKARAKPGSATGMADARGKEALRRLFGIP